MELLNQTQAGLVEYTCKQLEHFFPDGKAARARHLIERHIETALARVGKCIDHIRMWKPGQFNYLHSSQYCQYLYYLSNTIWREEKDADTSTRLFLLNKTLNGIDLFYEIDMPDVFFIGHSVGIVLAKATYGNFLVLYQNSTIGKNHGVAPVLGDGIVMYPNTAIIGRCNVGAGTILSQGTSILNQSTPGNCVVYPGQAGGLVFKPPKREVLTDIFRL